MKHLLMAVTIALALAYHVALAAPATEQTNTSVAGTSPVATHARPAAQSVISIDAGSGRVLQLTTGAASVFAADPKIAEVRPASATSLFIFGVSPGRTTVAALDANGKAIVRIRRDRPAFQLRCRSGRGSYRTGTPRHSNPCRDRGERSHGQRKSKDARRRGSRDADRAWLFANRTNLGQPHVRRVQPASEPARAHCGNEPQPDPSVGRQLGQPHRVGQGREIGLITNNPLVNLTRTPNQAFGSYNFPTPGHVVDINGLIDTLSQDELIDVLAQPNLTAVSGEAASFLVGGEFPIPVAQQNNQVTIEFKQDGVSLAFVPTVASDGQITLKVRTEVSQLTNQGAVQLSAGNSTIQVPAWTVRRAETAVELGSGESFAIAGLLQDAVNVTGNGVPFSETCRYWRVVPIGQFPAQRDRTGHHRHTIRCATGGQPIGPASADGRLSASERSRAHPAAAPDRPHRWCGSGERNNAANPRERRIYRAMMGTPPC